MQRLAIALIALVLVAIALRTSTAELDNQVFTSKPHRLRLVIPRGWRPTEQPSYPGFLLWMLRDHPAGKLVLTAEPFTREVYCSWPVACRASADSLPAKLACAMREKFAKQRIRVGPSQAGPKEGEQAGMPSVWFEIDDGKQFLRQAVAVGEDRIVSVVLSAPSADARNAHGRAFEQTLRTLRPLTPEELGVPAPPPEVVVMQLVGDAGVTDAPSDAAPAATAFVSAPAPKIAPVGPCANR
jgi:hypothetical protein